METVEEEENIFELLLEDEQEELAGANTGHQPEMDALLRSLHNDE